MLIVKVTVFLLLITLTYFGIRALFILVLPRFVWFCRFRTAVYRLRPSPKAVVRVSTPRMTASGQWCTDVWTGEVAAVDRKYREVLVTQDLELGYQNTWVPVGMVEWRPWWELRGRK